jgi:2-hydroxy-6-oxonona-2,4-dienedioate hydrolase
MMDSNYRSAAGKALIQTVYQERLKVMPMEFQARYVDTPVGRTHLIVGGDSSKKPLLVVHGANGDALQMALPLASLTNSFYCIFVDVPGEPNLSSEQDVRRNDDWFASWLTAVLDSLKLDKVAGLGVSGGAFLLTKAAALIPDRWERLVLITPQGFSCASEEQLEINVWQPFRQLQKEPSRENVARFVGGLTTEGVNFPDQVLDFFGMIFQHIRNPMPMVPLWTKASLSRLQAPIYVVAAGQDVLFPGAEAIRYAKEILPTLRATYLEPTANHIHPPFFSAEWAAKYVAFL